MVITPDFDYVIKIIPATPVRIRVEPHSYFGPALGPWIIDFSFWLPGNYYIHAVLMLLNRLGGGAAMRFRPLPTFVFARRLAESTLLYCVHCKSTNPLRWARVAKPYAGTLFSYHRY